jgi:alkylation response protein AidB-like acyl-CoA dehydrogenase
VAWGALGHATAAYEAAVAYCGQRQQFGKPLTSFQVVQDRLVKMLAEVCSMQLYCLRLGRLIEEGKLTDDGSGNVTWHVRLIELENQGYAQSFGARAAGPVPGRNAAADGTLAENRVPGSSAEARRPACYCLRNFAFSASMRC